MVWIIKTFPSRHPKRPKEERSHRNRRHHEIRGFFFKKKTSPSSFHPFYRKDLAHRVPPSICDTRPHEINPNLSRNEFLPFVILLAVVVQKTNGIKAILTKRNVLQGIQIENKPLPFSFREDLGCHWPELHSLLEVFFQSVKPFPIFLPPLGVLHDGFVEAL